MRVCRRTLMLGPLVVFLLGVQTRADIPHQARLYADSLGLVRQAFGNYMGITWQSSYDTTTLPSSEFPGGTRFISSAIYNLFAVDPDRPLDSGGFPLHVLAGDETWYSHGGDGI